MYRFDGSFNPSENKNNQSITHSYMFMISSIQGVNKDNNENCLDSMTYWFYDEINQLGDSWWFSNCRIKMIRQDQDYSSRSSFFARKIDDIYQWKAYYVANAVSLFWRSYMNTISTIPAYLSANQKDSFKYDLVMCCDFNWNPTARL